MRIPEIATSSLLIEQTRETLADMAKKMKDPSIADEVGYPIGYPTTFLPFDYRNGLRVTTTHMYKDIEMIYDSIGIGSGSMNMVIGKTSTAKTTFLTQAVTSMMLPFLGRTMLLYYDLEGGTSKPRMQIVTGWNSRLIEQHIILKQRGINSESFFTQVSDHCNKKLKMALTNPDMMTYDTGLYDMYGKRKFELVPTFVILDSLPLLVPKDMTEDEKVSGNMSAAAVARINTQIFKRLTPLLKSANVILFVVNHINQNININPFAPKQAQINYLKQDETLPGGTAPLYLSNNIIKFSTSTKLTSDKEFGINGWISKVQLIKSRMNRAGQEFGLIYNQETGFDRELSMFQMLHENGLVKSGSWSYLEGLPSSKFQKKTFLSKLESDEHFRCHMKNMIVDLGNTLLSNSNAHDALQNQSNINDEIENALFENILMNDFTHEDIGGYY